MKFQKSKKQLEEKPRFYPDTYAKMTVDEKISHLQQDLELMTTKKIKNVAEADINQAREFRVALVHALKTQEFF